MLRFYVNWFLPRVFLRILSDFMASLLSRVKCIGWACDVSISSAQWLFWYCTAAGTGLEPEPRGDCVPLGGDRGEEGEVAHSCFLKLFAETFKRHLAKPPGSTVFSYSLTFVFRYWYLSV